MSGLVWYQGRFAWPLIALFVYATVCVLVFDYVWRRVEMPFLMLLVSGIIVWITGSAVILAIGQRMASKFRNEYKVER